MEGEHVKRSSIDARHGYHDFISHATEANVYLLSQIGYSQLVFMVLLSFKTKSKTIVTDQETEAA